MEHARPLVHKITQYSSIANLTLKQIHIVSKLANVRLFFVKTENILMYVSTTFHGIVDKLHKLQLYSHHKEHVGYKALKAYLFIR